MYWVLLKEGRELCLPNEKQNIRIEKKLRKEHLGVSGIAYHMVGALVR